MNATTLLAETLFPTIIGIAFVLIAVIAVIKTARVVPQRSAHVVERLGKYHKTLEAGFHILVPFIDRVAYKHSLKEVAIDVPSQMCITKDNIAIEIDGVLYMQVLDAKAASYGIENYYFAASQLAQTTLRSEIGKIELDRTFEERDAINNSVIIALDKASEPWGLKITRYEIANIKPPQSVQDALEKQMRAERERRAQIALSEGQREAQINVAEGEKQDAIKVSEAKKLSQINEAEGKAREIELLATATADGIRRIAEAIEAPGGQAAVNLRIAEQYVKEFGNLAKEGNTLIVPQNLSDIGGTVASLAKILQGTGAASDEPAGSASRNPGPGMPPPLG
ncbi:stomatin/prohibitin superfamily protein [Haloferula helveola]|uniref:Stomatin/prohibitin superfamily protein n=1 Tax=Haloferula helveola TaxID=490095 RepID=A0ABM7RA28_9BACT|nr:stomatin/prohibitin superfamily protein [Haloferula helveola]